MTAGVLQRARCIVLEALYEWDTAGHDPETAYNRRVVDVTDDDPEVGQPGPSGFGRGVLRGVRKLVPELDGYIGEAATQFPVSTLAVVDRNILRLAIWELLTDNSAPVAAVVNEAVELAHRYGGESSPGFINGVLRTVSGRILAERGREQDREPSDRPNQEN